MDENVEYEEKEDEFDIASRSMCKPTSQSKAQNTLQEDEEEILKRKMKEEEEEVDVDTITGDTTHQIMQPDGTQFDDEDIAWAEEDADGDVEEFKMKILMQEDSEML